MQAYDTFTIEHAGREFTVSLYHDSDHGAPWEDDCGCGPVSDWTRREKAPGEMVLCTGSISRRYYDFAAATRIAKRDGWGLSDKDMAELSKRLGRNPTRKQVIRESVLQNFDRLRRWCNDDWHYCGVEVSCEGETDSLWGVESDCEDYIRQVAHELAAEVASRFADDEADFNFALVSLAATAAGILRA